MTRRIPAAAALLALLTALCVVTAMAAGAAVELPVRVTVSGDAPDVPEVFTLTLRAASDGAPLPEGSRNGAYTCAVSGGGSAVLTSPAPGRGGTYTRCGRRRDSATVGSTMTVCTTSPSR